MREVEPFPLDALDMLVQCCFQFRNQFDTRGFFLAGDDLLT